MAAEAFRLFEERKAQMDKDFEKEMAKADRWYQERKSEMAKRRQGR